MDTSVEFETKFHRASIDGSLAASLELRSPSQIGEEADIEEMLKPTEEIDVVVTAQEQQDLPRTVAVGAELGRMAFNDVTEQFASKVGQWAPTEDGYKMETS